MCGEALLQKLASRPSFLSLDRNSRTKYHTPRRSYTAPSHVSHTRLTSRGRPAFSSIRPPLLAFSSTRAMSRYYLPLNGSSSSSMDENRSKYDISSTPAHLPRTSTLLEVQTLMREHAVGATFGSKYPRKTDEDLAKIKKKATREYYEQLNQQVRPRCPSTSASALLLSGHP